MKSTLPLTEMMELIAEAGHRSQAHSVILARLIAEISVLRDDPPTKLREITTSLRAIAVGAEARFGDEANSFAECIGEICASAEDSLKPQT